MASSTLAIPTTYHKSTLSKLENKKVRSEDELLKFFLHGSYDVQRGNIPTSPTIEENKSICNQDETTTTTSISNLNSDKEKNKSRCMFEETYMINISVKQPNTKPSSKQIDVRIEKALSDGQISNNKKIDDDEISSIFDEDEEENDEDDSVIFNEINSSSEISKTKLTLADMITKTLTTIPALSLDNLNKINDNWYVDKKNEIKIRKPSKEIVEKIIKIPPSAPIQQATLTTNISEDEKLFKYLDYLETKEESNQQQPVKSSTTTKTSQSTPLFASKIPSKLPQQESIPILDLEQLCRSLTVQDLKDELIRKKIYELKILIDDRHKKLKSQIPLIKLRKDNLPILIAMPPIAQQRRRTVIIQPPTLLQSKSDHLQGPYNYHDMISNYNPPTNSNRKY